MDSVKAAGNDFPMSDVFVLHGSFAIVFTNISSRIASIIDLRLLIILSQLSFGSTLVIYILIFSRSLAVSKLCTLLTLLLPDTGIERAFGRCVGCLIFASFWIVV